MAIHTISNKALAKRVIPVSVCPSTISITPLINGTPGIKYNTLVARAMPEVVLKNRAADENKEATKADTIKII